MLEGIKTKFIPKQLSIYLISIALRFMFKKGYFLFALLHLKTYICIRILG